MKGFFTEFKAFIMKGNVLDLAVAVVMGAAFGAVVKALVDNIIMPIIGIVVGGIDVAGLSVKVGDAVLTYGAFLQAIINFISISFVIFIFVKIINTAMNKLKRKAKEEETAAVDPQVELLKEIRDLLEKK